MGNSLPQRDIPEAQLLQLIDQINSETCFRLTEYNRHFKIKQRSRTLRRWVLDGVYPSGRTRCDAAIGKVYLEAYRLGGGYVTSKEAVTRFMARSGMGGLYRRG